jgi:hypothetical protein
MPGWYKCWNDQRKKRQWDDGDATNKPEKKGRLKIKNAKRRKEKSNEINGWNVEDG